MKIKTDVIITSISSRADGSLRLSCVTPELSTEEKVEFINLQNRVLDSTFKEKGELKAPELKIQTDLKGKSQAKRIRDTLFVWYMQVEPKGTDFETFYKQKTETIITNIKDELE